MLPSIRTMHFKTIQWDDRSDDFFYIYIPAMIVCDM